MVLQTALAWLAAQMSRERLFHDANPDEPRGDR